MTFNPPFAAEWLALLGLALAGASLRLTARSPRLPAGWPRRTAVVLRLLAVGVLLLILLNPVAKVGDGSGSKPVSALVLVDTSRSMSLGAPSRLEEGLGVLRPGLAAHGEAVHLLPFAARLSAGPVRPADLGADWGTRTALGAALERALGMARAAGAGRIVVVSDGRVDDAARLATAAGSAAAAGIPVSVVPVGTAPDAPNLALVNLLADRQAPAHSRLPVTAVVRVSGAQGQRAEVILETADGRELDRVGFAALDGTHRVALKAPLEQADVDLRLRLPPIPGELDAEDNRLSFAVSVVEQPIRVLYMEGSNHPNKRWKDTQEYEFIAAALRETGSIEVDILTVDEQVADGGRLFRIADPTAGFPADRQALFAYDVVICSDINRTIFTDDQLAWTVDLVARRGGGFCMIGGYTAFGAGKWDRTVWEQMVPVDMQTEDEGYEWETVQPSIPDAARSHPVWHFDADPEITARILAAHPPFLGFNLVNRAKPAASVLAWHPKRQMPLICVQPYGRGRSMAFVSDAAGGWGERYQTEWGEGDRDNRHYRRFWVNAVRWLAENSMAAHRTPLLAATGAIAYGPGDAVDLRAWKPNLTRAEDLRQWSVTAWLGDGPAPGGAVRLTLADPAAEAFTGALTLPETAPAAETVIRFRADGPPGTTPEESQVAIRILDLDREFADPAPDHDLLRQVAARTGGTVIADPETFTEIVRPPAQARASEQFHTVPLWDRAWLWGLVILLLAGDWSLRRKVGFAAGPPPALIAQ